MSLQACADRVARGDPDRFAAAMAAPVAARRVLLPLYAFNVEVARAPWVTAEPMIAEMRLQWWRDALEEIAAGGPVRAHEITTPLAEILDTGGAELLDGAVAARRWDIYRDAFDDAAAFSAHLDATSGHLMWTAARLLGATQGEAAVRDLAWAAGLANWFCAIPGLEQAGRRPLVDGRAGAVAEMAAAGLARLNKARGQLPRAGRAAFLPAFQARGVLKQAARAPARVGAGRLGRPDFAKTLMLTGAVITGRY